MLSREPVPSLVASLGQVLPVLVMPVQAPLLLQQLSFALAHQLVQVQVEVVSHPPEVLPVSEQEV